MVSGRTVLDQVRSLLDDYTETRLPDGTEMRSLHRTSHSICILQHPGMLLPAEQLLLTLARDCRQQYKCLWRYSSPVRSDASPECLPSTLLPIEWNLV